jgi:hypothetical protein
MIDVAAPVKDNGLNTSGFSLFGKQKPHLFSTFAFTLQVLATNLLMQGGHGYQGMAFTVVNNLRVNMRGAFEHP